MQAQTVAIGLILLLVAKSSETELALLSGSDVKHVSDETKHRRNTTMQGRMQFTKSSAISTRLPEPR